MHLKPFAYQRPASLADLTGGLRGASVADETVFMGGGTDILVKMGQRLIAPSAVIGLKTVAELGGIRREGESVFVGAATTLQQVKDSALIAGLFPALVRAAASVGSPQLRRMGTIGGNLCLDTRCLYYNQREWPGAFPPCYKRGGKVCHVVKGGKRCYALFCADTPAALLALDARVSIAGPAGQREVPLDEFYRDDGLRCNILGLGEIVRGIRIPVIAGASNLYSRMGSRGAIDFPLVGLAVSAQGAGGTCTGLRMAATGVGSRPLRLAALEKLLEGRDRRRELTEEELGEALKEVRPVRHQGISAPYRKNLLEVLVRRALACLSEAGS